MQKFSDVFHNLYSVSKTLRFELKPVGNTDKMLEEAKVFDIDKTIKEKYELTKPFFDKLHRKFVKDALGKFRFNDLKRYDYVTSEFLKNKSNKKLFDEYQKTNNKLRIQLVDAFNHAAIKWSEKYPLLNIKKPSVEELLFKENVFELLKEVYGNDKDSKLVDKATGEIISIFDSWKGFTVYFTKFFETRKNFYNNFFQSSTGSVYSIY